MIANLDVELGVVAVVVVVGLEEAKEEDQEKIQCTNRHVSLDTIFSNNNEPSIEVAWAYYEHITLPRHLYNSAVEPKKIMLCNQKITIEKISLTLFGNDEDHVLNFAYPGENDKETRLYSPWTTHIL